MQQTRIHPDASSHAAAGILRSMAVGFRRTWPEVQAGHNQPGASFRVRWLRAEAAKAAIEKVQSVLLISTTDQTGTWKRRRVAPIPL